MNKVPARLTESSASHVNSSETRPILGPPKTVGQPDSQQNSPEDTPAEPTKNWLKIMLAITATVLIAGYFSRNLLFGTPVAAYAVVTGELRQTVVASGRVIWPQRISVAAEVTGRVKAIAVLEGQRVMRGQLLIQLEDKDERAARAQAATAVLQADAKLRQQRELSLPTAQQGLLQAQADIDQLSKQLSRMHQLKTKNFVSQAELDTATRNLEVATSKLHAAELQVNANTPKGSDAALAAAVLAQARANLQLADVKLEQDKILAPADGILISRAIEAGDIVQPGKELMSLAAQGETQLEAQIDEKNLAKLALGQPALGSADAFPDQRFHAEIVYINPAVDATRGSVEVKLRVKQPPDYLRQDMTVSIDIETAQRINTLVIPTAALHDPSSAAPWVLVVRNKRTVQQTVKLGLRGDERVEIISGLKNDEPVILASLASIKTNQRVRVQLAKTL